MSLFSRWYANTKIQDELLKHIDPTDRYDREVAALYNMHHGHSSHLNHTRQDIDSLEDQELQFTYMSEEAILKTYGTVSQQDFDIQEGHIFIMIHIQVK